MRRRSAARRGTGLTVLAALATVGASSTVSGPDPSAGATTSHALRTEARAGPCDDSSTTDWVRERRDALLAFNGLARFAVERYGAPIACEGEVLAEFDGAWYGVVHLDFEGGVRFTLETQPIETSITTLARDEGFADHEAVRAAARADAQRIGLDVDYSTSEIESEGSLRTEVYAERDPSMNAFVRFTYRGDALVAVRISLAL